MSYIPTEWQNGNVITAEKLNHAEEGIAALSNRNYMNIQKVTFTINSSNTEITSFSHTPSAIKNLIETGCMLFTCIFIDVENENTSTFICNVNYGGIGTISGYF